MRIVIQPSALEDLKTGYTFYEETKENLGAYFINSLYSDIESLHLFAGIHPVHFDKFHRLLSKRFPYGIYYKVEGDTIMIQAILDLRHDPDSRKRRLNHGETKETEGI